MLNYKDLYDGFLNIFDNKEEYSEDINIVVNKWIKVFENFYLNMILPISGKENCNLYASLEQFKIQLINIIKVQLWKEQFEIAIKNLHLGVGIGVTMTGIYSTIPPSSPLILKNCFNPNFSINQIANTLALKIFTWVSSTVSIQNSTGVIIKWM